MKEKWIKRFLTLAVLLLSLVSISTAACPRAMPELYQAQCGNDLVVSSPGILKNDVKDPGKTLQVLNPDDISIDPDLGTLSVNADGSFVYKASTDFKSSGYVIFYYRATDETCESNQAYVKIAVSCKCKAIAPEITVSQENGVDEELLMSMGAECTGCRDVTPVFDLTKVADAPGTYPYEIICTSHNTAEGHVTIQESAPVVTLYQHAYYEGGSRQYSSDTPNIDDYFYDYLGVSSLRVSPGYVVVLYEDPNYGGRSMTFSGDVEWVGDDFNDLASSLRIIAI
jgi:hypothetical protein